MVKSKNGWTKMRMGFGIADLTIGIMFLAMILTSDGGIENNSRMMGTSWFLIWCGMFSFLGKRKRWATITSIVFYSIGILYNISNSIYYPAHLLIALMMIVFLILTSISLAMKDSFL